MTELIKAVLKVMAEVKNIEKSMTVGTGNASYKGVSDKDVKLKIGEAMQSNGLALFQTKVTPTIRVDRWEEMDSYSKAMKTKQSVFTEVVTEYLLAHESGETITISGYGHGIDSQDKGAGKATTYALKNALLYLYLVPTGTIEDTDKTHSDAIVTPAVKPITEPPKHFSATATELPPLTDKAFAAMLEAIAKGEKDKVKAAMAKYTLLKPQLDELTKLLG